MRKNNPITSKTKSSHVWKDMAELCLKDASLEGMMQKDKEKGNKWHMWENAPTFIFVFAKNTIEQH